MPSGWKRVRYRLEWIGLLVAAKMIPLLSRKSCFRLAQMLGALMSILDRNGYRVALNNLEVAFGDELSEHERRKITRQSFQHFARTMVDFLWSPNLTGEVFSRYIELQNLEETARGTTPERGLIVACCHYSNFEWLSLGCGFAGITSTIIAQDFGNSLLNPIFKAIREQPGHELIPRKGGICTSLQSSTAKRKHRAPDRSYRSAEAGWSCDRLLWTKKERAFRSRLVA